MILPTFFKRRTSRRTSKRRQSLSQSKPKYDSLERRNLLATFVVTHADDVVADDGLLSLREAVIAANTNEAFSDAPAGDVNNDRIIFEAGELGADPSDIQLLTQGELEITDDLVIVGGSNEFSPWTQIESGFNSRIFNVNTTEPVTFSKLAIVSGEEIRGGLIQIQPNSDVSILQSYLGGGQARLGGAIHVVGSDLFIYQSTINQNAADDGGGIHARTSNIRLNDVSVTSNTASSSGGGIYARQGTVAAYGSRFGTEDGDSGNRAASGGAIRLASDAELLSNSDFTGNDGRGGGGAIFGESLSSITVFGGSFKGNGSLILNDGVNIFGESGGGAISTFGDKLFVANASFTGNIAANGGAIRSTVDGGIFRNLTVEENTGTISGGGLKLSGNSFLFDSEVSRNRSDRDGGYGGGISVDEGDLTVVLRRVGVFENVADSHGGGIAIEEGAKTRVFNSNVSSNSIGSFTGEGSGGGGGVSNRGGDLLMTNARINANTSVENSLGAGIFSSGGSVLAFDSSVASNSAERFGGGFYLADGYARFANSTIGLNQTRQAGGGAFVESGKLVFVGGTVAHNSAKAQPSDSFLGYGGGVAVALDGQLYVRDEVRFESNEADSAGGSISTNGLFNMRGSRIVSSSANVGGGINVGINGSAYINNSAFDFNSASRQGSAIYARTNSVLVFTNSFVRNNEVAGNPDGAPVVSLKTGFARIDSVQFENNSPLNDPLLDAIV